MGACASVSDSCMIVHIFDRPDTVSITKYICKGDTYTLGGQSFNIQDTFLVVIENGVCDSMVELDLRVIDIEPQIIADRIQSVVLANTNTLKVLILARLIQISCTIGLALIAL
ncbi:MAG: hypothetical protein IPO92_17010 [Saprospiraceae bacterium]|nr:hypothetical protein [Saprospiraceae bacterium]